MNIHVGKLSGDTNKEELRQAFEGFGQVATVIIMKNKFSGEPRGFGFVKMSSKEEGVAAITGLNGRKLQGNTLKVDEAHLRITGAAGSDNH